MSNRKIPIFIPHLGCPHQCVFCDQNSISGCDCFNESDVPRQIEKALATFPTGELPEIAYFGGSFTGIDRGLMLRLLDLAKSYVDARRVSTIRLSTRPDMIDGEILSILSGYPVRTVELGVQSTSDRVLTASRRGHTASQAIDALRQVTDAGFDAVGQMMIGLPESTLASELQTAEEICQAGAKACRIYPAVVFRGTAMEQMMQNGSYHPLTLCEAVERSAAVLEVFLSHGVNCLRIGLCASEELSDRERAVAGANHPALGELVWNEIYYRKFVACLAHAGLLGAEVAINLPAREISKYVGQKRCNLERLARESGTAVQKIYGTSEEEPSAMPWEEMKRRRTTPCI